jgi:hypothetical protein
MSALRPTIRGHLQLTSPAEPWRPPPCAWRGRRSASCCRSRWWVSGGRRGDGQRGWGAASRDGRACGLQDPCAAEFLIASLADSGRLYSPLLGLLTVAVALVPTCPSAKSPSRSRSRSRSDSIHDRSTTARCCARHSPSRPYVNCETHSRVMASVEWRGGDAGVAAVVVVVIGVDRVTGR